MEPNTPTPAQFLETMKVAAKNPDREDAHASADDAMCSLLQALGYGEAVDVFDNMDKWYA
jgi:hypothetical protein